MSAPTTDELVLVDVDLERVPACIGFMDPDGKIPCTQPATFVLRLLHRRDGATCATALACDEHKRLQFEAQRRIDAHPGLLPLCPGHLLPIDTTAVPL